MLSKATNTTIIIMSYFLRCNLHIHFYKFIALQSISIMLMQTHKPPVRENRVKLGGRSSNKRRKAKRTMSACQF